MSDEGAATPVLAVRGLVKRFGGVVAIDGVDFAVAAGAFHALIGSNGAGKTTVFNLLTGALRPTAGSIRLRGRDVVGIPPHRLARRGVGRTFQINNLFPQATVRENIRVPTIARHGQQWRLFGRVRGLHDDAIAALAETVGLAAQLETPAQHLAYGDQRRLELAVALAGEPTLLLLDEPTCGMAAADRLPLVRFIRDLVRARGMTAVIIEHDMDVVFSLADRITVMHRGRVLAEGAPADIRADPAVRAAYLGTQFHA